MSLLFFFSLQDKIKTFFIIFKSGIQEHTELQVLYYFLTLYIYWLATSIKYFKLTDIIWAMR